MGAAGCCWLLRARLSQHFERARAPRTTPQQCSHSPCGSLGLTGTTCRLVVLAFCSGARDAAPVDSAPDPPGWHHPVRVSSQRRAHHRKHPLHTCTPGSPDPLLTQPVYLNPHTPTPPSQPFTQTPEQLRATYSAIREKFKRSGLNLATVDFLRTYFTHLNASALQPSPPVAAALYSELEHPLPEAAVRLVVVPLDASPSVGATGACAVPRCLAQGST